MFDKAKLRAVVLALPLTLAAGPLLAQTYDDLDFSYVAVESPALGRGVADDRRLLPTISDNGRPILAPEGIAFALREQGFTEPTRIYYTGGLYTAVARTPRGEERSLLVDATTGLVIRRHGDHVHYGDGDFRRPAAVVLEEPVRPPVRIGRYNERSADRTILSFSKVRSDLEALGYQDCDAAGYGDGVYRIQARNSDGERVRLSVDAYTNEIISERVVTSFDDPWIHEPRSTRVDWLKRRLMREDYKEITNVRRKGNDYVVEAEDRYGDDVRLLVDGRSGRIIDKDYVG
jgi:hypothetical protein